MFLNVVIGKPIYPPEKLISLNENDWETNDKKYTLFTEERNLSKILVLAGVVSSRNEVLRNKPELNIDLNNVDCIFVKWGKKIIYIVVGE